MKITLPTVLKPAFPDQNDLGSKLANAGRTCLVSAFVFLVCFFFGQSAGGATYFIDYASGSDDNNGLSSSTPWQRSPGMTGFAGKYKHLPGDAFIFCGGTIWPNSVLPLYITGIGDSITNDCYTSSNGWFHGGAWTMPCFDAEGTAVGPTGSIHSALHVMGTNITISGLEVKNLLIPQATNWNGYGVASIAGAAEAKNITVKNCWLHDWRPGIDAAHAASSDSDFGGIFFLGGAQNVIVMSNRIGPGLAPIGLVGNSGSAVVGSVLVISSNVLFGCTELINSGATNISFNDLGSCTNSYDPLNHANVIFHGLSSNSKAWIYNNVIHDTGTTFQTMLLHPGYGGATNAAYYIFNNTIFHVTSPIDVDESGIVIPNSGAAAYLYNNKVEYSIPVGAVKRDQPFHLSLLDCRTNLWISDTIISNPIGTAASTSAYAPVEKLVDINDVWLTTKAAVAAGYAHQSPLPAANLRVLAK